jgi:hypothetical protein
MFKQISAFAAVLALSCPALATVTSTTASTTYACTGGATVFTVPFPYISSAHLVVTQTTGGITITLTPAVGYTVKPSIAPTTGTVTLTTACPSGSTLTLARVVPFTQPQSFRTGSYQGPVHEQAFDRLAMEIQQLNAKEVADIGNVNNTVAAFNASGAAIGSTTSVLATGSTFPRTLAARAADTANVKDFNAKGDGITDDTVAIDAAQAAVLSAGKVLYFPCGNYLDSHAITIGSVGSRIQGAGKACTTITFTGATDGIVVADVAPVVSDFQIDGLTLTTTNASGGKALNLNLPLHGSFSGTIRDVTVLASGSGRWAYCGYSNNWQTSEVFSLRCFQSATVGWHFDSASDAIDFYGVEIVGSTGAGTITRAIEVADTSGGADIRFFGGTLQGWFTNSLIWMNTLTKGQKFYGLHLENTNATPSDGADVVGIGTNVNTAFDGIQGGSFNIGSSGTWRNFALSRSEVSAVTIGVNCVSCGLYGVRAAITDNSVTTTILNCSSTTGLAYGGKVPGPLLKHNTAAIPTTSGTGLDSSAGLILGNDATLDWQDSTGAAKEALRWSAADQVLMTYAPTKQITFRNSTPTTKMILNDTSLTMSVPIILQSSTFSALGNPANGTLVYCSDCTVASPCAAGGTGALAKRLNAVWVCN